MKKTTLLILVVVMIMTILACAPKEKITYTKEFPYLPAHEAMKLQEFEEGPQGGFGRAVYEIEGEFDSFLANYEEILKKDSWEITDDKKPDAMTVTKGENTAVMTLYDLEGTTTLIVLAK